MLQQRYSLPFHPHITFTAQKPDGVIVAQGGSANGYSLYLQGGKLVFAHRVAEKITQITTTQSVSGKHTAIATLEADGKLSLTLDGQWLAKGKAPALAPRIPSDGLDVGLDRGGLVGDYATENAFSGTIESVKIELSKPGTVRQ